MPCLMQGTGCLPWRLSAIPCNGQNIFVCPNRLMHVRFLFARFLMLERDALRKVFPDFGEMSMLSSNFNLPL